MPLLPVPEFLRPVLGSSPRAALIFTTVVAALGLGLVLALWLAFGRGPHRRRAYRRAQRFLRAGDWASALNIIHRLQAGRPRGAWHERLRRAEAQAHVLVGKELLKKNHYQEALGHLCGAARLLGEDETAARSMVAEAMLAQARQLFAASTGKDAADLHALLAQVFRVQSPCPEAAFWKALCLVREGNDEQAIAELQALITILSGHKTPAGSKHPPDPYLYLGALLLRRGEPKEALRWLTEANRLDSNCPFIIAQLGSAMIASGGDAQIAVRALQKALGPRGFLLWKQAPQRAWIEGMPEASYVRRLASERTYICPLWGGDLGPLLRQAGTALGEGLYRLGNFQESADVFQRLFDEGAPSAAVLRGLGLALARLGRYDQAFKHLRAAHELVPEDRTVAGYLALCAARGKPLQPEDLPNNIAWAVWLVGRYEGPGDAEWAGLVSAIFAEARTHAVPLAVADQVRLCDLLVSVLAADPPAAEAFHHLQASDPQAVKPAYAWLYCRAAQLHGLSGDHALDLFARTFADEAAARAFYEQQGWDFDEVTYAFLVRAAEQQPGRFPAVLGPDYSARGAALLLERSRRLEEAKQPDAALAAVEVLHKLAPANVKALDRMAQLHYRAGNLERARELLQEWAKLQADAPLPWVRQAVICQQRGDKEGCLAAINQALGRTKGRARAEVAFLGARLLLGWLFDWLDKPDNEPPDWFRRDKPAGSPIATNDIWQQALALLEECLGEAPDHTEALWCAAAVRSLMGDSEGLAAQAPAMKRPDVADPRFHFLAGVCHLAAGDHASLAESCGRAAADPHLALECAYLMGWDCISRREPATAALAFQRVAQAADSPSASYAQAILGAIRFHQGAYEEAAQWWQRLEESKRESWGFAEPLAGAVFLAALKDLREGRFQQAAARLRESGKLGRRDRRLGPLLALALFKAGQQLLYASGGQTARGEEAASLLEQAIKAGCQDPNAVYLLALCYKRLGKIAEARTALRKIAKPDANVLLQLGLLSLAEQEYAQAEEEFSRSWQADPASYPAAYNLLLTRLALGKLADCAALLPQLVPLTTEAGEKRFLILLAALLHRVLPPVEAVPVARPAEADVNGQVSESPLAGMSPAHEERLLQLLCGVGPLDATYPLLRALADARPNSPTVQAAHLEVVLAQAKRLADHGQWTNAAQLLQPMARLLGEGAGPAQTVSKTTQLALLNLLGLCDVMTQEFAQGAHHFAAALKLAGEDAWLHQNLALTYEFLNRLEQAEFHWNRYFDLLDVRVPVPTLPNYREGLAFEALNRLGEMYLKKEKWSAALPYVQRASRLRPQDVDTLERLFHLYHQVHRPDDARRTLRRLRELRPNDPQYELYELDLRQVRTLDDIDRMLGDVRRILSQYPNDMRVEERAVGLVGNVIPHLGQLCDQHSDRLARIVQQVRRLPSYQINWPVVHDEIQRLLREFQKLRRLAQKCLPLVSHAEHRRVIKELTELIDSKIEVCQSLRG
jgi:tetratricopeptide (TPR) repeat protein